MRIYKANDLSRDYIFDGNTLHRDRPDYQLCDITDPLIAKYINDPANVSETCDVSGLATISIWHTILT